MKIVVIGGGSSYTPELIEGILEKNKSLNCTEIVLVDVEMGKEKQDIIYGLSKRMIDKSKYDIKIYKTINRREALKDADFIAIQMRIGQLQARVKDEEIPSKYGYIGQETNGFGGFFKALRTIPIAVDIANEVCEMCPDAWIVNFTNPSAMVTEAILKYSNHNKVIGLCNGPINMSKQVAKILNIEENELYCQFAGSNHMVFITKVMHEGKNIMNELINKINKENIDQVTLKNINNDAFNKHFLNSLQMVPIGYLKYYVKKAMLIEEQEKKLKEGKIRALDVEKIEKELFKIYSYEDLDVKPKQLEERGGAYYSTAAINLIDSIINNTKDIQVVNVINNGTISNLDDDAVVEVNSIITNNGALPLNVGELDDKIHGLINTMKKFEKQTIKVALSGNYDDAIVALTFNPLIQSDDDAQIIFDELLVAHEEYLPNFRKSINRIKNV